MGPYRVGENLNP